MSKADYKQLEQSQQKAEADRVTSAALAPSERKDGEGASNNAEQQASGLTKVPPESAIAGKLIRLWVDGGVDSVELVSKL